MQVPDDEPVEPDRVAEAPLAAALVDPERAVLERHERRREQDRVRLAGERPSGRARCAGAVIDAAEPARRAAPLRVTAVTPVIPLQSVELRERPERHLLQAEHVRPVGDASSTISSRWLRRPGGDVLPWKRFQLRTSTRD